jgi:conjugal transfer pilus assembly protein TraW
MVSRTTMHSLVRNAAAVACLSLSLFARAGDLGTIGPVYPIVEPDMLEQIQAILKAKQASGDLERVQQAAFKRMRARIQTPTAVSGLAKTRQSRVWTFDPSVRFDEPIVDNEGRIVIPAGTLANPLSVVRLSSLLLFVDGRDQGQVATAKRLIETSQQRVVLILTAGSPASLMSQLHRQVFFDQDGLLVRRFGIQAVPARVSQDGLVLRVEEFPA